MEESTAECVVGTERRSALVTLHVPKVFRRSCVKITFVSRDCKDRGTVRNTTHCTLPTTLYGTDNTVAAKAGVAY